MEKHLILSCFLLVCSLAISANDLKEQTLHISYYNTSLEVTYSPDLLFDFDPCANDRCLKHYYRAMEKTNFQGILDQLEAYKKQFELTDWLYFKLIRKTVEQLYQARTGIGKEMSNTMGTWFFMSKAGYDTRLSNLEYEMLFLYVHSKEDVVGIPKTGIRRKRYYNLTNYYLSIAMDQKRLVQLNKIIADSQSRPFGFKLTKLPQLPPQLEKKEMSFEQGDKRYTLTFMLDRNVLDVMNTYPAMEPMDYVKMPMSQALSQSLLPQFRELLASKSQKEALEILLAFTRTSFTYKWDWEAYNKDQSMIADEIFFSEFSDHEDRCALFYNLVKELLDLPMIIISHFNSDLTVAVATKEVVGQPIDFNAKEYTLCDPTTPVDKSDLGIYPKGLRHPSTVPQVVGEYKSNSDGFANQ